MYSKVIKTVLNYKINPQFKFIETNNKNINCLGNKNINSVVIIPTEWLISLLITLV